MRYLRQKIKNYPFTTIFVLVIWFLSFCTTPKTELDDVPFIDKWTHIAMYGGTCTVLWIEYLRNHCKIGQPMKLAVMIWLLPILMSGAIELLQEYCTGGRRSGDWFDLLANAVGVTLAAIIGLLLAHFHAIKCKES